MAIALFPGQGVQAPGMQATLPDVAPEVFETAGEILGVDVTELCATGRSGDADLRSTRWAQPAVLTCSVASFHALGGGFEALAGHSVGEYAALVCGGSLTLADALGLIALRAEVTAAAAARTPGAMAAVMRADPETVAGACERAGVVIAADNAPGQMVVSGAADRVEDAVREIGAGGGTCRRLEVDGAFHSPLMAPAAEALEREVARTPVERPSVDLWSPTTGSRLTDPDDIRRALVDQLTAPVRWRETLSRVGAAHPGPVTDIGPGRVVGALARRIIAGREIAFAADMIPAGLS